MADEYTKVTLDGIDNPPPADPTPDENLENLDLENLDLEPEPTPEEDYKAKLKELELENFDKGDLASTFEALAKGKAESNKHIKTIEEENARQRAFMEQIQQTVLERERLALQQQQQAPAQPTGPLTPQQQQEADAKRFVREEAKALIQETMQQEISPLKQQQEYQNTMTYVNQQQIADPTFRQCLESGELQNTISRMTQVEMRPFDTNTVNNAYLEILRNKQNQMTQQQQQVQLDKQTELERQKKSAFTEAGSRSTGMKSQVNLEELMKEMASGRMTSEEIKEARRKFNLY